MNNKDELEDLDFEFNQTKTKFLVEANDVLIFTMPNRSRYTCISDRNTSDKQTLIFCHHRTGKLARIIINQNYRDETVKECVDIFAEDAKIAEQLKNISCKEKLENTMKTMKEVYQLERIAEKLKYGI